MPILNVVLEMVLPLYLHPRLNTEPVENLWAVYNSNLLLSQKVFAQHIGLKDLSVLFFSPFRIGGWPFAGSD